MARLKGTEMNPKETISEVDTGFPKHETVPAKTLRSSEWVVRELAETVERRGREIMRSKKNYRGREGRMEEWAWMMKLLRSEIAKLPNEKVSDRP